MRNGAVVLMAWAVLSLTAPVAPAPPAPEAPPAPPASPELEEINRLFAEYRADFPGVAVITVGELLALEPVQPVVFVDVRPDRERNVSRIPGSVSRREFERTLKDDEDAYVGYTVVAYCTIGYRSGEYAEKMQKKGVEMLNLQGSILAWVHAGQPVEDRDGPTVRVHVYGKPWALLPEGYEAVW